MAIVTIFWFIVLRQISSLGNNLEIMKNEAPLAMINEKLKVKEHENSIPLLQSLPKARTKKISNQSSDYIFLPIYQHLICSPSQQPPKSRWLFWLHPSAWSLAPIGSPGIFLLFKQMTSVASFSSCMIFHVRVHPSRMWPLLPASHPFSQSSPSTPCSRGEVQKFALQNVSTLYFGGSS